MRTCRFQIDRAITDQLERAGIEAAWDVRRRRFCPHLFAQPKHPWLASLKRRLGW